MPVFSPFGFIDEQSAAEAPSNAPLNVEYIVLAGGGGGRSYWGGKGGAGGYRSSISGEISGGGCSAESILSLDTGVSYNVSVGAGGSAGSNGGDSSFNNITSIGGGAAGKLNVCGGDGGSGGGGGNDACCPGSGTSCQGFDGVGGDEGCGGTMGLGGGAGGINGLGVGSKVLTHEQANSVGVGYVHDPGYRTYDDDAVIFAESGIGRAGSGGGAVGDSNTPGFDGTVILRYPSNFTINVGSGLTSTTFNNGDNKVTTFTAGTDTISFS
jgi:hypothetical protein